MDAADLCRRDDGDVGFLGGQEHLDGRLAREIKLDPVPQEQLEAGLLLEPADEGRAHHPLVARDEELGHGFGSFEICDSRFARSRSWSTMIFTSSLKRTFGFQPSCRAALAASPISRSTSAGRS